MLNIYNTIKGRIEEFEVSNNKVKMYVCGPTVYNFIHIGNARPYIFFDVVRKYLKFLNYEVTYVQNFTDIDDKIINISLKDNITIKQVSEKFIDEYLKDSDSLNIARADLYPKVSDSIEDIIKFIELLVIKGYGYKKEDGVYFEVNKFKNYGELSNQNILSIKDFNNRDFALWKFEDNEKYSWDSPFGRGRPGWHIECSAMILKTLGQSIDIHGGGQDLIFPHHENERAQSESCNKKILAKYWLHNAFVNIKDDKMSKSLNNFILVRDLLNDYDGEVIRLMLLSTHYRKPIEFSFDKMESYKVTYKRIENFLKRLDNSSEGETFDFSNIINSFCCSFDKEISNDFNIPGSLGIIFDLIKQINSILDVKSINKDSIEYIKLNLRKRLKILGLEFKQVKKDLNESLINILLEIRNEARKNKNWKLADEIRDKLLKIGLELKDNEEGTDWSF